MVSLNHTTVISAMFTVDEMGLVVDSPAKQVLFDYIQASRVATSFRLAETFLTVLQMTEKYTYATR